MKTPFASRRRLVLLSCVALALTAAFVFQQLLLGKPLIRDDAALFVYPLFCALAKAFQAGHLYLWDSQQWCGLPALATGQSGGLYPLHWLILRLLPWRPGLHVLYWLHLALALVAMVGVARKLGLSWRASVVGGTLYAFSGYSAAHLVHYNFIAATAHLPLTVLVLQIALTRNQWRWWGLLGLEVALAFCVCHPQLFLMILAVGALWLVAGEWWRGDGGGAGAVGGAGYHPARRASLTPQPEGKASFAADGGPGNTRPLRTALLSRLPGLAAAAVIAALLMMPQLLPTLEMARETKTIQSAQSLDAETVISSYPFRWIDLPRVVLPDLFGTAEANVIGGGPAFHETCAFVTIGALLLGLVGLVAGGGQRGWWFAVLVLIVGASLVPAANPIYLLVAKVPFLNGFRAMGRWALVALAGLSLLVSLGLDSLPQAGEKRRELTVKLVTLLGVLLLLALAALWATFGAEGGALVLPGHPDKAVAVKNMASAIYNSLIGWEPLLFVWSAVLALVVVHLGARRRGRHAYAVLAFLAIAVPLWSFWQVTNRPGPKDYYTAVPATFATGAKPAGRIVTLPPALVMAGDDWQQGADRLSVEKALLTPALGTVYPSGNPLLYADGYKQGLVTPSSLAFWGTYYRYSIQAFTGRSETTGETVERVGTPTERMKRCHRIAAVDAIVTPGQINDPDLSAAAPAVAGVRRYAYRQPRTLCWLVGKTQVVAEPSAQLEAVKLRTFDPDSMAVVDQPVAGLTGAASGSAELERQEGGLLTARVSTTQPSLLVIAQAWYPGWRAYVDGQPAPLLRADYAIKAVPVPVGDHAVVLRFQSATWARGMWLGIVGLALCVGLLLIEGRRTESANGD